MLPVPVFLVVSTASTVSARVLVERNTEYSQVLPVYSEFEVNRELCAPFRVSHPQVSAKNIPGTLMVRGVGFGVITLGVKHWRY